jgi:hypothetical protein
MARRKVEHGVTIRCGCGVTQATKSFIEVIREFMLIAAGLGSANKPIPLRCELLNEGPRKLAVAAPALPHVHRMAGEFGRAVLRIFEKLEATVFGTIEAQDNSFAEFGRLVLMSELHSALQIIKVRCHCLFNRFPSRL